MRSQLRLKTPPPAIHNHHPPAPKMAPTAEDEARPGPAAAADDGEDDYMNMVIEEPNKKETPLQKMQREKREVCRTPCPSPSPI